MAKARVAIHADHDILRPHHECGHSQREIACSCKMSVGGFNKILQPGRKAGLWWPLPPGLNESDLEERLYGRSARRAAVDFAAMRKELAAREGLIP